MRPEQRSDEVQLTKRERVCMGCLDWKDKQQRNNCLVDRNAAPQISGRKWTLKWSQRSEGKKMLTITLSHFINIIDFGPQADNFRSQFPVAHFYALSPRCSACRPFGRHSDKGTAHAASSGFLASPNPIAAISAARAAGKGTTLGRQYFFPPTL